MLSHEIISQFLDSENRPLSETFQVAGKTIKIVSTKKFAAEINAKKMRSLPGQVKPLTWSTLMLWLTFAINTTGFIMLVNYIGTMHLSLPVFAATVAGLLIILLLPVYMIYKAGEKTQNMKISLKGIEILKYTLFWDQLSDTLLVNSLQKRFKKSHLVLVTQDRMFVEVDLNHYLLKEKQLALLIELYKQKAGN